MAQAATTSNHNNDANPEKIAKLQHLPKPKKQPVMDKEIKQIRFNKVQIILEQTIWQVDLVALAMQQCCQW
jgi:hypothetical protein